MQLNVNATIFRHITTTKLKKINGKTIANTFSGRWHLKIHGFKPYLFIVSSFYSKSAVDRYTFYGVITIL